MIDTISKYIPLSGSSSQISLPDPLAGTEKAHFFKDHSSRIRYFISDID